jgi:hypothetical protein
MDSQNSSQEKRVFTRVSLDVVLFFKADKPPEVQLKIGKEIKTGRAVDVSEAGISFLTDVEVPKFSVIGLIFDLIFDKGNKPKVTATGEVVYCFPREPQKSYRIGIVFLNLKETDRKLIAEYVKFVFLHPRYEEGPNNI